MSKLDMPHFPDVKKEQGSINWIKERSHEILPEMKDWYSNIHKNPELGGEELDTAKMVKKFLEDQGIEIAEEGIGGAGIIGIIRGRKGGPTVALRADMDALPVQEATDNPHRSCRDGVMHACGHDAHTSGLMGATKILKELADSGKLNGDVVLLFQSSEEKSHQKESGAVAMVRAMERNGIRKKIEAFFGLHVYRSVERGVVNVKDGVMLASSGEIDIVLKGPGGHIINAYDVPNLHLIFSEITMKLSEIFEPLKKSKEALVASSETTYYNGAYNVLPSSGDSTWVVRIASPNFKEVSKEINAKIKSVVAEIVQKHAKGNASVEVSYKARPGYRPVVHRDPKMVEDARSVAKGVVQNCKITDEGLLGGEDFSFYLESLSGKEIPGVYMMVGAANPEKGIPLGSHHTPDFRIDTDVLEELAALHAAFSLETIQRLQKEKK